MHCQQPPRSAQSLTSHSTLADSPNQRPYVHRESHRHLLASQLTNILIAEQRGSSSAPSHPPAQAPPPQQHSRYEKAAPPPPKDNYSHLQTSQRPANFGSPPPSATGPRPTASTRPPPSSRPPPSPAPDTGGADSSLLPLFRAVDKDGKLPTAPGRRCIWPILRPASSKATSRRGALSHIG